MGRRSARGVGPNTQVKPIIGTQYLDTAHLPPPLRHFGRQLMDGGSGQMIL
jgi:hypothetical protein